MLNETWKPITGFENYKISPSGKVMNSNSGKVLAQRAGGTANYKFVSLWKSNKEKHFLVHRLVATHYIDNPLKRPQVHHIDFDTYNNDISNLMWVTVSQNHKFTAAAGRKNFATRTGQITPGSVSKYLNVTYDKSRGKWKAGVKRNGKQVFQKRFDTELEAANAAAEFVRSLSQNA